MLIRPLGLCQVTICLSHTQCLLCSLTTVLGSTLEGLDLAFGLTMAIVVCRRSRVDCTNLAHGRKQALKSKMLTDGIVCQHGKFSVLVRVTDLFGISTPGALIVSLSQLIQGAEDEYGCPGLWHCGMSMACNVAQVALSVNSMSLCGLIHAAVMKTGKMYVAESEEAEFMKRCREFALQ